MSNVLSRSLMNASSYRSRQKIAASFFFVIGAFMLMAGVIVALGIREGRAAGAFLFVGCAWVCGYLFWPVKRKKTALDFVLGAFACLAGAVMLLGTFGLRARKEINFLGAGIGAATLLVGVGLFLKNGSEPANKPTEPPLLR